METRDLPPELGDWIYIEPNTGCWLWLRDSIWNGYGRLWKEQRILGERLVHRVVYRLLRGAIPQGMFLHHRCRTRSCCNPEHLKIATASENSKLGWLDNPKPRFKPKEFCKRGHALTPDNRYTTGNHECKTCARMRARKEI